MNIFGKYLVRLAVALAMAHWLLLNVQAKEPSYNGKPLSEWICCALPDEQEEAFMHLGTNCLPIGLDIIGATDNDMKRVARRLESKEFREKAFSGDGAVITQLRESASRVFDTLGTNAVSAIPRLIKILNDNDEETSIYAADALGQVGPRGLIALTNLLASKGKDTRTAVVMAIAQGPFDPNTVTPILAGLLKDKLPDVRRFAADGLRRKDPSVAIRLLTSALDDPDLDVKAAAASALGSYGTKAGGAVSKLVSVYTNSITAGLSFQTCQLFSDALRAIDLNKAREVESLVVKNPINPFRHYYTRTRLTNGLDLIAGGYIRTEILFPTNHYLASAELYDAATGKWTETGKMAAPRYDHAAVLLPNGQVLVAGGGSDRSTLASAELYDPSTGKWTKTESMRKPNGGGQLILQRDGKVLFVNGIDYPDRPPFDKELYDPTTGAWEEVNYK